MKLHLDHAHPTQIMMRVRTAEGAELMRVPTPVNVLAEGVKVDTINDLSMDSMCRLYCERAMPAHKYLGLVRVDISEFSENFKKKRYRTCGNRAPAAHLRCHRPDCTDGRN